MTTTSPAIAGDEVPGPAPAAPIPATALLVRRAAAGDHGAFERLVRSQERRVLALAWRLLGDRADAEDAAQEAFLRLYRALGRLDPARPVTPFLDRITVNVCHDLGRRRTRRREVSLEPETDDPGQGRPTPRDGRADPAADAALAEARRLAARALRELPFKQRAALVLRELHGLTTREVAAALDATETTVRSHVCRARLALRDRLAALRSGARANPTKETP